MPRTFLFAAWSPALPMMPRTLLSLLPAALLLALAACSPESTSPLEESASDEITAIHIAQAGIPVDSVLRTGALGSMSFELLLEARDGTMHRHDDARTVWGSTHPSIVDEVFRDYVLWCERSQQRPFDKTYFSKRMKACGVELRKKARTRSYFLGTEYVPSRNRLVATVPRVISQTA